MRLVAGILGNVVATVLVAWVVHDGVVDFTGAMAMARHNGRWWRMGLVSLLWVVFPAGASALHALLRPALLAGGVGVVVWWFPRLGPLVTAAWGIWVGAGLGLVYAVLGLVGTRSDEAQRIFMSISYDILHEELPARLSARQQTFVKPYRLAHEEQQRTQAAATALEEWAGLSFSIQQVWTGQKATDAPPYFEAGGDWTVLLCGLQGGRPAAFFLAERSAAPAGNPPIAWGEGRVWVTATGDADALLAACRAAFPPEHAEATGDDEDDGAPAFDPSWDPGPAVAPGPPLRPSTVALGREVARTDNGFSGRGTWSASKWFFDHGATEVFVNYSLAERRGELAEKDDLYRAALLQAVAALARREGRA